MKYFLITISFLSTVIAHAQNGFNMQRWTGAWGSDGPVFTGDLNGDRKTDVFMWRKSDNAWTINLSTGNGFTMQRWVGAWGSDGPINTGDLNGDGKTDIFMWRQSDNSWTINLSTGGGFNMQRWVGAWGSDGPINTGDLNGDGKTDVFMWRKSDNAWTINLSTGSGFAMQRWTGAWGSDGPINTGDLNGDGKTDVFMWRKSDNAWTINLSTGSGFNMQRWTGAWGSDGPVNIGDLNGDGKTDVFMFRQSDNTWTINLSTGSGFRMEQWFGACLTNSPFVSGDFNGDRRLDVAVWNNTFLKWTTNISTGSGFNMQLWNGAWGSDGPVRTGDLNGDGRTDVFMWRESDKSWTVNLSVPTPVGLPSNMPGCGTSRWQPLGPYTLKNEVNYLPCGGRIDAIAISNDYDGKGHPAMFTGSPGGGVFRWATNFPGTAAPVWEPLTDHIPAIVPEELRIGINGIKSIAIAPNNPRMIFASTSSDPLVLLKSTDGGNTWSLAGLHQFQNRGNWINAVTIDEAGRIYVACNTGLYISENGGMTFANIVNDNLSGCAFEDVIFYTDAPNSYQVFAGVIDGNSTNNRSGIWRVSKTNNGYEYNQVPMQLKNMLNVPFAATAMTHIKLSATQNVGAVASLTTNDNSPGLLNIFQIIKKSTTYSAIPKWFTKEPFFTQQGYVMGLCIAQDGRTYGGGIGLAQADVNGNVLNLQAQYNNIHVDEHVLVAYNGKIYAGTDGGLYRLTPQPGKLGAEKPESWEHLNSNTHQNFLSESVSYNPMNPFDILAGHQDNGIAHFTNGEWSWISNSNESDFVFFDPNPANKGKIAYAYDASNQDYLKSKDGGASFTKLFNTIVPVFTIAFHPSEKDRFITSLPAGNKNYTVKETRDGLDNPGNATDLKPPIQGLGCPTAICYAGKSIYVCAAGKIFRYDGQSWATVYEGPDRIQSIVSDAFNPNTIYFATAANTAPFTMGKIFRKPDQTNGMPWSRTSGGDLEDMTGSGLQASVIRLTLLPNGQGKIPNLYAATQLGVFKLKKSGLNNTWSKFGNNLPDTPIWDIVANPENRFVYSATYGRGVWYTQDLSE